MSTNAQERHVLCSGKSNMSTETVSQQAAAIRAARVAAGLTVRGLASRINVSAATISAIENGKTGMSVARLHEVAAALQVSPSRLLTSGGNGANRNLVEIEYSAMAGCASSSWQLFPSLDLDPVLCGAIDCFVETGYHGTSMRTLAARIGVSVPTIYHYYADKQQLLVRILDVAMSELHWRVAAARAEADNSRDEVAKIVEALALFHTHQRKLAFIGASEMRSLEGTNRQRIIRSRDHLQRILDEAIDRAIVDGFLHTPHSHTAARAIATMCTALPQWFHAEGALTPGQIAKAYVEFALSMLGAKHAAGQEK